MILDQSTLSTSIDSFILFFIFSSPGPFLSSESEIKTERKARMLTQRQRMATKAMQAAQPAGPETAQDVTAQKTSDEVVADEVIRGVDGSQSTQPNSLPNLLLDPSTFATPHLIFIPTSQIPSSLTLSLDSVNTPDSSNIGFVDSGYRFPSNSNYFSSQMFPSPPINVSRPNLKRSQFSSYRTEATSDLISYSPSGLFPHHEVPEDETSDDGQVSAQNGWTLAQRLREAALSDWESHRNVEPASPIRPVLSRNPSSNYSSSVRASQSSISSPLIPQPTQLQTPTRPNLYHTIRTWALESSEATLRQPVAPMGEFPFGSSASRASLESAFATTTPSAVFASSPLAGKNLIFGTDRISKASKAVLRDDNNVDVVGETVTSPSVCQPSPVHGTSCSPLHRHLARRSVSSCTYGFPTSSSLKQNVATPPLITTRSFAGPSSEAHLIGSVFEEEENVEPVAPTLKIEAEGVQSLFASKGLGESPALSKSGHLAVPARPKTKRYKSCDEIVQQKPSLVKSSTDPLREKTLSVLGLIEFNMKHSSRSYGSNSAVSVTTSPAISIGHDCGRAQSSYEMGTSYFPTFVS